ncbi:hypothetical protein GCM10009557_29600 [Virgisporangium ochraceum]
MTTGGDEAVLAEAVLTQARAVTTVQDLAAVLRRLRRRQARGARDSPWTLRELAARTGWAHSTIGQYLSGQTLPPTDRFDALIHLFGATPVEQGALASARDRVEETQRRPKKDATGRRPVPALEPPAAGEPVTGAHPSIPRQLPARVAGFAGRAVVLTLLDGLVTTEVTVAVISGTAGVGKTALAVHWAHRVADRFPDGQFFVNLRGFEPTGPPLPPDEALRHVLDGLGVPADRIPSDPGARAGLYRTAMAGRRMLIVLDNAASVDQVRPLLPGSAGCLVLVTSRRSLAGLDNAVPLELPLLSADDGTALLSRLLGDTDRPGLAELVELCGRLPLALRLVSARLRHRPSWTVEQLASRLRDEHARLGELYAGERSVGTTIALSYHLLADEQRHLVCTLRRLPVAEGDVRLAAAAAGLDTVAARRLLDRIVDAHLLEERVPGRYRFHDLVRLTARDLATAEDGTATRRRFLTAYLHTLHRAVAVVRFGRLPGHLLEAPALTRVPFLRDHDAAAWLRDERDNLVTVVRHAAEHGDHDLTWQLAATLGRLFPREHRCDEWLVTSDLGARAAAALGKPRAAALMRVDAGNRHYTLGRADLALDDHLAALALADDAGDDLLDGYISAYTGRIHQALGQADRAEAAYRRALANPGFVADRREAAYTELDLNAIHVALGRYDVAGRGYRTSIDVARRFGDRNLECFAHYNVAHFLLLQGDLAAAEEHARAAVDLAARIGYPVREARGWEKLGEVLDTAGRVEEAVDAWTRAAAVYESVADPRAADLRRRAEKSRWQGR